MGDPQDELQVAIHSDNNGVPGSLLGRADFPGTDLDGGWAWVRWDLPNALPLALNSNLLAGHPALGSVKRQCLLHH